MGVTQHNLTQPPIEAQLKATLVFVFLGTLGRKQGPARGNEGKPGLRSRAEPNRGANVYAVPQPCSFKSDYNVYISYPRHCHNNKAHSTYGGNRVHNSSPVPPPAKSRLRERGEVILYPAHLDEEDVSFVIISYYMPPHGCLDNKDVAFAFLFTIFTFDYI